MKIGHIHLKVRDLEKSVVFYRDLFGLQVTEKVGDSFVFMSSGAMHHELALQEVGSQARVPGRLDVGLYHVAFEVPDKQSLARFYRNLKSGGIRVYPVDHRISWALYFSDPDGNGIEVYWDTRGTNRGETVWKGVDRPLTEEQLAEPA